MKRGGTIHHQSKHHAPPTGPQRPEWLLQEVSSSLTLPVQGQLGALEEDGGGGRRGPLLCCSQSGPNTFVFLVYSFAFSVVRGPPTLAICFLLNFLAKCLSVWSQTTSM